MKLPKLEELNTERFLNEAFDAESNAKFERSARLRRNIFLGLFLAGIACIFITALTGQTIMSILSLFLATLSLLVMTKYETQLFFLTKLKLRGPEAMDEGRKR